MSIRPAIFNFLLSPPLAVPSQRCALVDFGNSSAACLATGPAAGLPLVLYWRCSGLLPEENERKKKKKKKKRMKERKKERI